MLKTTFSPSQSIQTTLVWGEPSGLTVAATPKLGSRQSWAWLSCESRHEGDFLSRWVGGTSTQDTASSRGTLYTRWPALQGREPAADPSRSPADRRPVTDASSGALPLGSCTMLFALSTGHQIGLAVTGAAFIVFSLLSSFVFPRLWPEFPGQEGASLVPPALVPLLLRDDRRRARLRQGAEARPRRTPNARFDDGGPAAGGGKLTSGP